VKLPSTYAASLKEKLNAPDIQIELEGERANIHFPDAKRNIVLSSLQDFSIPISKPLLSTLSANPFMGSGLIGSLKEAMSAEAFLAYVKSCMDVHCIRHTAFLDKSIQKVAICGGSGSFLLQTAIAQKADAYISADFKYHEFFDADGQILILDIGHFESEQYTIQLLYDLINQKFSNFAVHYTDINTNPINYYT
ncbi:MAG: Nif3-like dinuclear metal center hexameric protein, partial [Bacteroidota bacterium]